MIVDFSMSGVACDEIVENTVRQYNNGISQKDPHFLRFGVESGDDADQRHYCVSGNFEPEEFITELASQAPIKIKFIT